MAENPHTTTFTDCPFPLRVRIETPVKDVPDPALNNVMKLKHAGEELVIVQCGDKEYRFSSWYGAMQ